MSRVLSGAARVVRSITGIRADNPPGWYRKLRTAWHTGPAATVGRLNAEVKALRREIRDLRDRGPTEQVPSYDADNTRLWSRNLDFLEDPKFVRAYQLGINSGHQLAGEGIDDIHIEYRIAICCWVAWHCMKLPGDFVECGTNTGIMSLAIFDYTDFARSGKTFYLFDTFEGIPEEQIGPGEDHAHAQNRLYRDCYEIAQRNFSPYPNARLVRGIVPGTLTSVPIDRVAYVMLDMNIVTPEREALAYLWDRIVPGGVVLFDDYGWSGYELQKSSHDEFAASRGLKILNLPTGQGMLIKP